MGRALFNLFEFFKVFKINRCQNSSDVKTGDIVVCWDDTGKNTVRHIKCLGTVKHVGRTPLAKGHEDGDFGEVFVLPFHKARTTKGKAYNRKYACLIACVLIF